MIRETILSIPLDDDGRAVIRIPQPLPARDAARIMRFVNAMVEPAPLADTPAGEPEDPTRIGEHPEGEQR